MPDHILQLNHQYNVNTINSLAAVRSFELYNIVCFSSDAQGSHTESLEGNQSWSSWAWSYVPQILPAGEEELPEGERSPKKKPPPAVLAVGMYAHKASLTFKVYTCTSNRIYRYIHLYSSYIEILERIYFWQY